MSKVEVNTVDVQSGSTLTLGSSGKTVTLATGATQSGFGRTGTVDWCTTAKTSPLTAVSGKGYFINTTAGTITVTLPSSPSAGDIVALKDYAGTWDNNNVTLGRGGSKINGNCQCATLGTENQSVTMIYVDGTKGWQDIHDSTSGVTGEAFVAATGGTITTCGDYKIHTFTSSGCFQITSAGAASGSNKVSYLVVAGGGGGGRDRAGGGGAGGFREGKAPAFESYTASPLVAPDGLPASIATYPIAIGGGGAGLCGGPASADAGTGSVSTFSTITSAGGGRGGSGPGPYSPGGDGGSGGGGDAYGTPGGTVGAAGSGDSPPVTPPQGKDGGIGVHNSPNGSGRGGGGGGATVAGTSSTPGGNPGGAGATTSVSGSPVAYAGGGGGGDCGTGQPTGGTGGGGKGGSCCAASTAGTANTGGGGGGGNGGSGGNHNGKGGGSGVVIIRYKFQ